MRSLVMVKPMSLRSSLVLVIASIMLVLLSIKGLLIFHRLILDLYWLSCLFADRIFLRRTQHVRLRWTIFVSKGVRQCSVYHMFLAPGVTAVS